MDGGSLNLEILKGRGGGGLKQFWKFRWKVGEGGGVKNLCLPSAECSFDF